MGGVACCEGEKEQMTQEVFAVTSVSNEFGDAPCWDSASGSHKLPVFSEKLGAESKPAAAAEAVEAPAAAGSVEAPAETKEEAAAISVSDLAIQIDEKKEQDAGNGRVAESEALLNLDEKELEKARYLAEMAAQEAEEAKLKAEEKEQIKKTNIWLNDEREKAIEAAKSCMTVTFEFKGKVTGGFFLQQPLGFTFAPQKKSGMFSKSGDTGKFIVSEVQNKDLPNVQVGMVIKQVNGEDVGKKTWSEFQEMMAQAIESLPGH
eukprot:TRINITY_DN2596_c0_g1_i5.p1 TRINITY_DN2596_c0_g1~~TRINITY_DN2596_c0_g1_i5.p1  ORF type:complete len:262 (+),score=87.18 TRINITY_DN2596_c0_g1_i5:114-899(+)